MGLTQSQKVLIEKTRSAGGSELATGLNDEACAFIVATIARDLNRLDAFPEIAADFPEFFKEPDPQNLEVHGLDFYVLIERLFYLVPDADTYFACLGALQKSRLKYARILEYQPIPTMDQVGPRALLQYGLMNPKALAGFLLWRKWLFDIDNRAGQETGYLFEPIIANAIGGEPFGAKKSPIKRHDDKAKGRQVDCIRKKRAYEIKLRVTIAASGQGRWKEELDFPVDCKQSGFKPVLVVLDPTPNPKLNELNAAFKKAGGETYVGDTAWHHLEEEAGEVMSIFLEKYVKTPMQHVLDSAPEELPNITLKMSNDKFSILLDDELSEFRRTLGDPADLE
ncbi:MAG: hypothetical protein WCG29_13420 [Desulfomonile sp.]